MNANQIIDLWPTRAEMASDIGADVTAVHSWAKRNRIAAVYDVAIVNAAARRGYGVTFETLARSRAHLSPRRG